jgi:tetratricopeptide (TPR) repeat protein
VSKLNWLQLVIACPLLVCAASAVAQHNQQENLDREFKSAVAQFDAGRFSQAAVLLEDLLPRAQNSFEVHELLGQAYSSLSQDDKAIEQLQVAVRLKPDSGPARTSLAATLLHAGKTESAGGQFRKALDLEPWNYDTNHNLGEFYIQAGNIQEALPFLEKAQVINSAAYDNGYDLATADLLTGRLAKATQLVEGLLLEKNTGELHDLLGQIEEKDGKFIAAANEFQMAAHLDPSEENLFDWGSELLLHRTYEPATEVFEEATKRYPSSPRLMIGLAMALDWRGRFDEAVKALLKAADLNPSDARCYLFLSKAYDSSPNQADEVIQRFKRYAELQPGNAMAQYYYAMSLWKGKRVGDPSLDLQTVESLLTKAIMLDNTLPDAHLQLGNLYADQHKYAQSVPEYIRALELNPNLPDAHYRLGTDYVHMGQRDRAQKEFDVYQKLRAQHLAEVDKERAEVQQFVYEEKVASSTKP